MNESGDSDEEEDVNDVAADDVTEENVGIAVDKR